MRVCLFEDRRSSDLFPLTLTRPVFDLLGGLTTLEQKQSHYFAPDSLGYLVRPLVAELTREMRSGSPVNDPLWLRSGPTVLVNARWVPPSRPSNDPPPTSAKLFGSGPFLAVCEGELAYAAVTPTLLAGMTPNTLEDCLEDWLTALPCVEVGGFLVRRLWELVDRNAGLITNDFTDFVDQEQVGFRPAGVSLIGSSEWLYIDPSAHVDPMVLIDTTEGPVVIAEGAKVSAFSRLVGPCYIGPGTQVNAAHVCNGSSIGPHCRIGGEVEASILQGYTTKAHEGYLGHSFIGEWVNLAPGTQTSDLRTDFGPISVPMNGVMVPTNRLRIGSLIGDHSKTGLGVLLNCGSVIGPFSTMLPTGTMLPREVPGFCRVGAETIDEMLNFEDLFATAATVMAQRGRIRNRVQESLYRAVAAQTSAQRLRLIGGDDSITYRKAG